jgi:hypothetical protein
MCGAGFSSAYENYLLSRMPNVQGVCVDFNPFPVVWLQAFFFHLSPFFRMHVSS